MQFLLLVYGDEAAWQALSRQERAERSAAFGPYVGALTSARALVGAYRPQPSARAATVRVSEGTRIVDEGPAAKTPQQLAGLYVIDVADREAALSWAAKNPASSFAVVEVRPVEAPPAAARPG